MSTKSVQRQQQQKQRIEWRRDKVREYSSKGYTLRDIAAELKVSLGLIEKDLKYLRQQAKQNISHYVDEYLPAEYQYCLESLNMIVKEMWALKPQDNRELMQSRSLIKDCCAMRIDLLSSATVVDRAVKFVDKNKVLVNQDKAEVMIDATSATAVAQES